MQCTAVLPSGTFLWSVLLLPSREPGFTHLGLGQGGGVQDGVAMQRSTPGTHPVGAA